MARAHISFPRIIFIDILMTKTTRTFHGDDIKNGHLENGLWMKAIEEVKEKYPKPTTPPPH